VTFDSVEELYEHQKAVGRDEGGPMFAGFPDRWWGDQHWRCTKGHVSTMVLRSEALKRDACLAGACRMPLCITFPEDRDD
jgi:hypothetical protein